MRGSDIAYVPTVDKDSKCSVTRLSLVVATGPWEPHPWRKAFSAVAGARRVYIWPGDKAPESREPYVRRAEGSCAGRVRT